MSQDHQLKRITDKIKELKQEQDRLMHALMRNRREEQYELDRIRREYTTRNNAIIRRQEDIEKEMRDKGRELDRIQRIIKDEQEQLKKDQEAAAEETKHSRWAR